MARRPRKSTSNTVFKKRRLVEFSKSSVGTESFGSASSTAENILSARLISRPSHQSRPKESCAKESSSTKKMGELDAVPYIPSIIVLTMVYI